MNIITPIQTQYNQPAYTRRTNFCARPPMLSTVKISEKQAANAEKTFRNIEMFGRKLVNKVRGIFTRHQTNTEYEKLMQADIKSPEYTCALAKVSRLFATKKELEINLESDRIKKIAQSGKPHIFIMNHDSQSKDPKMLAFFNTLLSEEYVLAGKAEKCPRPKIILNEDILLSMNEKERKIFEKLGAVGIDASIADSNKSGNTKQFVSLIKGFIRGENNIYIFPEGKFSVLKDEPLENKFQLGVAEIVSKLTGKVDEVNVTPIGFAYGKGKKSVGDSIFIGETVTFRKNGDGISATLGNVNSEHAAEGYKRFFRDRAEAVLTENGETVTGKELSQFVGGVLCENLRICKEEAISALPKTSLKDKVISC